MVLKKIFPWLNKPEHDCRWENIDAPLQTYLLRQIAYAVGILILGIIISLSLHSIQTLLICLSLSAFCGIRFYKILKEVYLDYIVVLSGKYRTYQKKTNRNETRQSAVLLYFKKRIKDGLGLNRYFGIIEQDNGTIIKFPLFDKFDAEEGCNVSIYVRKTNLRQINDNTLEAIDVLLKTVDSL